MQRAEPLSVGHRGVRRIGLLERLCGVVVDDGVQIRIQRRNALRDRRHHLAAREPALANAGRELGCAQAPQFIRHV